MGIARTFCRKPLNYAFAAVLACISISMLDAMFITMPRIQVLLESLADKYDAMLPEVVINQGRATVKDRQPFFVDLLRTSDVEFIVDTRPMKLQDSLEHLKGFSYGILLTRTHLIAKNGGETKYFTLKNAPDMVINSENLKIMLRQQFPGFVHLALIFLLIYFLISRPIQVIFMALIPLVGTRGHGMPITFQDAMKLAAFGMMVPVCTDFVFSFIGIGVSVRLLLYAIIFMAVMIQAARDLRKDVPDMESMETTIHSS
jgi:hypothetical protein